MSGDIVVTMRSPLVRFPLALTAEMKMNKFLHAILPLILCCWSVVVSSAEDFESTEFTLDDHAALIPVLEGVRRVRVSYLNDERQWQVYSLVHLAGNEGRIKLRLPDGVPLAEVCVEVSESDPFPFEVYQGRSEFVTEENGGVPFYGDYHFTFTTGNRAGAAVVPAMENDALVNEVQAPPEVQESDLWKWRGETLYFFNQLRGLQVFDFSDPTRPKRIDSLRMPDVGEDMYLHPDGEHLILLAKRWSWRSGSAGSEAVVVRHSAEGLTVTSRIPLPGNSVVESRMVGSHLYVALQNARRVETVSADLEPLVSWESGMTVEHINLSDPANPVSSDTLNLFSADGRWSNALVTATSEYFIVALPEYDRTNRTHRSNLHLIDIRDQSAPLNIAATAVLDGLLKDKFKLRIRDGILTCVTQGGSRSTGLTTVVANYHLSEYREDGEIPYLDSLTLAPRETLFATRFDGDRLYVVTAIQIDPLFVVDLSDAHNLRLLGELKIPGWSHYLQPRGDRLLSVGVEGRRVAISQFDVSDPANMGPPLRVYLGEEGSSSWSEANYDEQAIGYFPERGLLIVPFEFYGDGRSLESALQILTFSDDSLEKAGVIETNFVPRRATLLDSETLVSVSGREVNVLDVSDLSEPQPVSAVETAWTVDRVIPYGDHFLQIESVRQQWYGWGFNELASTMTLRVTPTGALDTVVGKIDLAGKTLVGVELHGDLLHLLTRETGYEWEDGQAVWADSAWYQVVDLSDPTAPVAGELMKFPNPLQNQSYRGHPLRGGLMAWVPEIEENQWGGYPFYYNPYDLWGSRPFVTPISVGNLDRAQILIVDGSDPAAPILVADHRVGLNSEDPPTDEEAPDISTSVTVASLVGHGDELLITFAERMPVADQEEGLSRQEIRYHLRVASLAANGQVSVGPAVNVPGRVEGVRELGDKAAWLLLSTAPASQTADDVVSRWPNDLVLQTSAFDGWKAFLIDEVTVPGARHQEIIVTARHFVLPNSGPDGSNSLAYYSVGFSGEITDRESLELDFYPNNLVHDNGILATNGWSNSGQVWWMLNLDTLDENEPAVVRKMGQFSADFEQMAFDEDRSVAWVPVGRYGVEAIDLEGLLVGSDLVTQALSLQATGVDDTWVKYPLHGGILTDVSANDEPGPLSPAEIWRYRATGPVCYADWMARKMGETDNPFFVAPLASADGDGDGRSNWTEYAFGTNPARADAETLQVRRAAVDGQLEIAFDLPRGRRGMTWELQFSHNLIDWEKIPRNEVFAEIIDAANIRLVARPHFLAKDKPVFFKVVLGH